MTQDYGFKYAIFRKNLDIKDRKTIGFSSELNTPKMYVTGTISKAATHGVLTTIQVVHGLAYRPAFNGYYRDTLTGEVYQIASGFEDTTFDRSGAEISVHMKSNNYNLTFDIYNAAGADKNVDIFYEAWYEDLVSEPIFIPFSF